MALFQTETLNMVGGNGYVVTLPRPVGSVTLYARAECYVQIVGDGAAPQVPTSAAIPTAGNTTAFFHMLSGDSLVCEASSKINESVEYSRYIAVWAVGTGNLATLSLVKT